MYRVHTWYQSVIWRTKVRGLSHPAFNIKIQVLHYIALTCSCSALKLKLLGFFVNVHDIKVDMFSSESIFVNYTRKHAQVVTSLQTSCYRSVHIYKQVVTNLFTSTNKLLPICSHLQTSCYRSVHIYKQVVTNLFTSTNKLLPICSHLQTSCYQSVHIYKQVVTNLFTFTNKLFQSVHIYKQVVTNLFTSTNKLLPICSHLQTSCYQSVHIYKQVVTNLFTSTNKLLPICSHLQTSCYQSVHIYKQVVTKLSTSCLRTACSQLLEQVWNKLLTTCNKLDGIIRLVTRLLTVVLTCLI